ncbi:MAG: 50S ribosomal protein L13 [Planctomycetota bacterium]|jgi:large subunit ribosomal protein L13
MKTPMAKRGDVQQGWYIVDASQEVLGRAAVKIATRLQGKHRPTWTPHSDTGDFIVVVNAEKIRVTGAKDEKKIYDWYTGYPSGRKTRTLAEMREQRPEQILRLAVRRMLPKSRLGRHMLKKLKIYAGTDHPHAAQNPEPLALDTRAGNRKT